MLLVVLITIILLIIQIYLLTQSTISALTPIPIPIKESFSQKKKINERFTGKFYYNTYSELCQYIADVGYICPLKYVDEASKILVQPLQKYSPELQLIAADGLFSEFSDEMKVNNTYETIDYLITTFHYTDVLYVLTVDDKFVGCVAVDRRNFYPFISHLFVVKGERKKGYSKLLMYVAEVYIKLFKFTEAKLWCKKHLQPLYARQGYKLEDKQDDLLIMSKKI